MISVLYVDDEPALLEATRIFMERGGEFKVETATSAREAIGKLKEERYDALVSDYQMPEMDGIEFLKYLRPRCDGMPFILFTGKGGEEVAIEALNAGADFYVSKGDLPRARFAELETKIRSAVARRQSERALRESERAYRSLVENLTGIVFAVSDDGILTYASPRISRFGYDPKDVTGKDFAILVCAEDIPTVAHHFARVKQGMTSRFEFRLISKSRQSCRVCASCRPQMDQERCAGVQGLITEIPEDKKEDETPGSHGIAEEKEARQISPGHAALFEEIFRQGPLACLTLSRDGRITGINRAALVMLGCPADTVTGRFLVEFIAGEDQARFSVGILELKHSGSIHAERFALARKGGCAMFVSLDGSVVLDPGGTASLLFVTLTDITGQVRDATALQVTTASAEGILTGAREGILVCTPALVLSRWNPAMEDITGIPARDACGKPLADLLPFLHGTGPSSPPVRALAGEIVATPDSRYEYPGSGKCGWARAIFSPLRDARGDVEGIIGVVQEITLRTTAARGIRSANRLYAISSRVSTAAVKARDLETLLAATCRIAADEDAIGMAWIGLFDHAAGILRPVAHAGTVEDLPKEECRVADAHQGPVLAGDAIRTGKPVVCRDAATDPAAGLWREDALRHGYRSLAAVPFRLKGEIVGVLTLCSGEPDAFSDEESEQLALLGTTLSAALDLLDKKTLQRRAGRGSHGSWERTRFLAGGLESASVPFAAVFPDGSTGAVNASLCTMLGYTEDEMLALPLKTLILDSKPADEDRFLRVITTKIPDRYESSVRTKDGTLLPVEIFLQAMTDETSGQSCAYAFITDISDRKQRTDLLEEERQQYLTFFETASAAVMITTPEGAVLAANPAACRLFGRTEAALRSAEGGGLAGTGDPRFVELSRTCKENGTAPGELRLIRDDGTQFDAAVRAAWIKAKNGQAAMNLTLWDITVQKMAGAAIKQDQNCVISILDSLPNPLRRSNPDGECVFFNKAWLAFTGRALKDERGEGWMEGIHPDDRDRYRETLGEQENRPSQVEYRLRYNTGEYRWIREVRIPGPAPDGTETGITFSCFDIHECRLTEEALTEERAQYRAMFENTADATLLVSDRILDCNAAAIRLFAGTREDLTGHDLGDFFPRYQPDGRASEEAVLGYLGTARGGMPQTFPWVIMRTDGTTRETCVTLTTLDIHGNEQVLVVIEDLTEGKQAEREIQRLASFPQMNPNPVIEVRPDRTITYTNPATAAVLSSLGMPDDPAAFLPDDFNEMVKTLNPAEPMRSMRIVHLKERSFNESISSAPGQDAIRIYAYDITDRVQAAEALTYANHKLGILTSITRHDIQNKLTGVLGYLDLIRSSLRDPRLIGFLDKAETSANAIRHHIDFTKDYESLGGTAPAWQEIRPILAEVRSHVEVGEIAFEEPAPGFAVFADPMFGKVLYNLCDNSLRHGVHVRHIRIRTEPVNAGCMLIYEDDGVGIPQDKKERIFERGFTTSSGSAKSSGLGLFLVRDILAITGISIQETGVPGAGSRFEMVIPPGKWRIGPAK